METSYIEISAAEYCEINQQCCKHCITVRSNGLWIRFTFADHSCIDISSQEIIVYDADRQWIAYLYLA